MLPSCVRPSENLAFSAHLIHFLPFCRSSGVSLRSKIRDENEAGSNERDGVCSNAFTNVRVGKEKTHRVRWGRKGARGSRVCA